MSRNLYVLAASLLLFSLVSCGMMFTENAMQPGLPGNGSLWKTTGLFLFLGAVVSTFAAVMSAMFEQVERRNASHAASKAAARRLRDDPKP